MHTHAPARNKGNRKIKKRARVQIQLVKISKIVMVEKQIKIFHLFCKLK